VLVAHACNPSYAWEAEIRGSWLEANSLRDLILKKSQHKKELVEWLKVKALSSNPSTTKKNEYRIF
jgi:hypothetical protein